MVFREESISIRGSSPGKLALEFRIDRAARLLFEGNRSVKEFSHDLGFTNPYNFSRVFKRVRGVSPSLLGHLSEG